MIEPVHSGSSRTLKVRFLGHPVVFVYLITFCQQPFLLCYWSCPFDQGSFKPFSSVLLNFLSGIAGDHSWSPQRSSAVKSLPTLSPLRQAPCHLLIAKLFSLRIMMMCQWGLNDFLFLIAGDHSWSPQRSSLRTPQLSKVCGPCLPCHQTDKLPVSPVNCKTF